MSSQCEAAQVISREVGFDPLRGQLATAAKYTSAVYEIVQSWPSAVDLVSQSARSSHEAQIVLNEIDVRILCRVAQVPLRADTFVVAASHASKEDAGDVLRLLHVAGGEAVSATAAAVLPGTLTALWAAPGSTAATAVVHDALGGRYEALQVSIVCAR